MGAEQDPAAISEAALVVSQLFLTAPNPELRGGHCRTTTRWPSGH